VLFTGAFDDVARGDDTYIFGLSDARLIHVN
jgi:hypothetical protein